MADHRPREPAPKPGRLHHGKSSRRTFADRQKYEARVEGLLQRLQTPCRPTCRGLRIEKGLPLRLSWLDLLAGRHAAECSGDGRRGRFLERKIRAYSTASRGMGGIGIRQSR